MFGINSKNFYEQNKRYFKASICAVIVIVVSALLIELINDFKIAGFLGAAFKVMSPFIYGLIIAYILNSFVGWFEESVLGRGKLKSPKLKRILSVTAAYLILLGTLVFLAGYILPELVLSIQNIIVFFRGLDINTIEAVISDMPMLDTEVAGYLNSLLERLLGMILDGTKYIPNMLNAIIAGTVGFANNLLDFIIGLIIAFYMLCDKERFASLCTKVLYVFTNRRIGDKIILVARNSNSVFRKFFVGKIIDSLIIGILFFIGCLFIKPPYILLLSIIIGITNIIPYFGPFIGAVPVIFITFLSDPSKSLWIAIFILVLQQFDGNILGPRILGDSTGLKPIGVIFAIVIFGALFGPLGMFFGVPIFAVLSSMFTEFIERKYNQKMVQ